MSPLQASVMRQSKEITNMPQQSRCLYGFYDLEVFNILTPEVFDVINGFSVTENKVRSLQEQCRCAILNELSQILHKLLKKLRNFQDQKN